jgi:hypothetical protein
MPTTMQDHPEGQEWVLDMVNSILIEVYTTLAQKKPKKLWTTSWTNYLQKVLKE